MSSDQGTSHRADAAPPTHQPLPEGYLWRLCVVVTLLVGGALCVFFFSTALGSLMSLAGIAFGKLSGLNDMIASEGKNPTP